MAIGSSAGSDLTLRSRGIAAFRSIRARLGLEGEEGGSLEVVAMSRASSGSAWRLALEPPPSMRLSFAAA